MHTLWRSIFTAYGNTFANIATSVINKLESQFWLTAHGKSALADCSFDFLQAAFADFSGLPARSVASTLTCTVLKEVKAISAGNGLSRKCAQISQRIVIHFSACSKFTC